LLAEQALNYRTPSEVFAQAKACGHVDNARGVDDMPTVEQQQQLIRINSIAEEGRKGIHFLS
jgi:hypothetical protein